MIFLRHPTPDVAPGICYGRTDLDIAEIGHQQIVKAVQTTPGLRRIIASPALRCRNLATALADRDGLELMFDERLWEMHMGDWEGLAWKDIDRSLTEQWLKDPINIPTPNGESFSDLQKRVGRAIDELGEVDVNHTAIVCHAGPIRATRMAWEKISFADAFAQTPAYAEPLRLFNPAWKKIA